MTPALVVLAGGGSRRLGTDKTAVVVDGRTLLDHALGAVPGARTVVAVGPARPTTDPTTWTLEDPPGSGPAAGLQAGLRALDPGPVVVLAADLPRAAELADALLADALPDDPDAGRVVVDEDGRPQWTAVLLGAAAAESLRQAPPAVDAPLHTLLRPLGLRPVTVAPGAARDVDTPTDLADLRRTP